jgi:hypothetical protein
MPSWSRPARMVPTGHVSLGVQLSRSDRRRFSGHSPVGLAV